MEEVLQVPLNETTDDNPTTGVPCTFGSFAALWHSSLPLQWMANLESFLEGKIRLCQKSTLYFGATNTVHQSISQHIVQADVKCAMFRQTAEFCHELQNHLAILLQMGVKGESLDGH